MKGRKGFGEVASTLIMFMAVIGITIGLVVAFQNFVVDTQGSFKQQQDQTSQKLRTSFAITNTYYNSSSQTLYVYFKNTGRASIESSLLDVFLDERFEQNFSVTSPTNFSSEQDSILIQDTATVIINSSLQPGTHTVEIVSQYGVRDEESFNT